MADEYNGWTNRETWAAALHLSNDEGLYHACREVVAEARPNRAGEALKEWFGETFEDPDEPLNRDARMMISDIGSLWRVNWDAVAASFAEES